MISIASRINARLDARTLIDVIEKRPNLREVAIKHVTRSGLTMRFLVCFRRFVEQEIFIDDVSLVEGAKGIVEAPSRNGSRIHRELRLLIDVLRKGDRFAIYSALWLASKYLTAAELLELLHVSSSVWKSDVLLGRVAGGLWPHFLRSAEEHRYHSLIEKTRNPGALKAFHFMRELAIDNKREAGIRKLIVQPNTSKPLQISHPKMSMLLCILSNSTVSDARKKRYIETHMPAWQDDFYRAAALRVVEGSLSEIIQPPLAPTVKLIC